MPNLKASATSSSSASSKPKLSSSSKAAIAQSRASLKPSPATASAAAAGDKDDGVFGSTEDEFAGPRGSLVSQMKGDDEEEAEEEELGGVSKATTSGEDTDVAMAAFDDGQPDEDDGADDSVMLDPSSLIPSATSSDAPVPAESGPLSFAPVSKSSAAGAGIALPTQKRTVPVPPHRFTPLKRDWVALYTPLVEECGLLVRMNQHRRKIELKTSKHTSTSQLALSSTSLGGPSNVLQRAVDFLTAYTLGFDPSDALVLLRMEECYIESFEVKDVKTLTGDHLSRAIGRIAGKDGKTKYTIENASRTRIVLADTKIHILGTFASIKIARDAVCNLILGSPPGKVYAGLKVVARRQRQRM